MYIKKIVIEKNGGIIESYNFTNSINVVCASEELYQIISLCMGIERLRKQPYDIKFLAVAELEKTYYIRGKKDKGQSRFTLSALKEDKLEDCIDEFCDLIIQSEESNDAIFFKSFKKEDYPHKLLKYKDLLTYYPKGDFAKLTNGYGTTRSFRGFIATYIKHYKPLRLRENKELYLKLSQDGEFRVGYLDNDEDVYLSESENILYHYFSFISVADFWTRAEKIRNFNFVSKPLLISNFLEFLDESINLAEILERTNKIGRQVIMLVPKSVHLPEYNIIVGSEENGTQKR